MLSHPEDDEVGIHLRHCVRRHRDAALDQHLEPQAKALRVERFVEPGLPRAPEVEIADRGQLAWGGEDQQLAARLEPAVLHHPMQHVRRQLRNNPGELRRVQQPVQQRRG